MTRLVSRLANSHASVRLMSSASPGSASRWSRRRGPVLESSDATAKRWFGSNALQQKTGRKFKAKPLGAFVSGAVPPGAGSGASCLFQPAPRNIGLKFAGLAPIQALSRDNGGWQPARAKGKTVEALPNSTRGMDAV